MTTPTTPDTAISNDIAPDTAARDQPNCSVSGLRKSPKHSWVPKEPTNRRNETATITQPYEKRLRVTAGTCMT